MPQRLYRVDYIRKLQDELAVTEPEQEELDERREWETVKELRRLQEQKQLEEAERAREEARQKQIPGGSSSVQEDEDAEEEELLAKMDKNKEEVTLLYNFFTIFNYFLFGIVC